MKKINKYIGQLSILIFSLLLSCNNFEDINTNPDTTTTVSSSLLCTEVVLSVAEFSGTDAKAMITENALPKYVGYANEGQMNEQYNKITNASFSGMTVLPNIVKMIEYAEGSVTEDSYKGVAKFVRAYMFYNLTMKMGDIPYSETNQGDEGNYTPTYDTQQEILIAILDELIEADEYFAIGNTFTGDPTPYDGDPEKWRRATNALALKILISLSDKVDVSDLAVKSRFAEIVTNGYLMESTTGYWGLEYSTVSDQPLYGTNDLFTSKTIISSLLIDNLKNLNDRRMYYIAEPALAQINTGLLEDDADAYVGVDVSMDYSTMNTNHSAGMYSLINLRFLNEPTNEPRMLLTYAEQELILAEARIRGWITAGTAENYYEEGVESALTTMMEISDTYAHGKPITQSYIDSYFTDEAAFKTTTDEQLKQIWMQRYILNFFQDANGSFFEYRRNTYPEFPINSATSLNVNNTSAIPMRWLYPSSESSYNNENLVEALESQYDGYDEINKLMWLLK
jgi:hypothetical protein